MLLIIKCVFEVIEMKKYLSLVLASIMAIGTYSYAFADDSQNLHEELVDCIVLANEQLGITLTQSEIEQLNFTTEQAAQKYCEQENISLTEAYDKLLDEVKSSMACPDPSVPTTYATKEVELVPSATGNIYFVDSGSAWNHVGLYTAKEYIVESMPEDGVQYWKYNATGAHQFVVTNPQDGVNDSCILSVNTTSSKKSSAAAWPEENIPEGTPYDFDPLDNKADYYNAGKDNVKSELDALNCSELVWRAYKKGASIDLDGNGGLGVYPNDILASSKTIEVQGNWW